MSAASSRTERRPRRGGWVTAAALVLVFEGGLGLLYAPALIGADLMPLSPLVIIVMGIALLKIAAGLGLLRLAGWARLAAGALAVYSLVFMYAPVLIVSIAHGTWLGVEWLGIVAYLVVLFGVVRRWQAELER